MAEINVHLQANDVALFEPVELTLRIMTEAGFDDETSARCLTTLANLASSAARERVIAQRSHVRPRVPELREALEQTNGPRPEILYRLAQADLVVYDDVQLLFGIDLVLDGMAATLARATRITACRRSEP
jgi:hypothetical protein